jgi:hypothetical protein
MGEHKMLATVHIMFKNLPVGTHTGEAIKQPDGKLKVKIKKGVEMSFRFKDGRYELDNSSPTSILIGTYAILNNG